MTGHNITHSEAFEPKPHVIVHHAPVRNRRPTFWGSLLGAVLFVFVMACVVVAFA